MHTLRVYTKEFGFNLVEAAGRHTPAPTMRQKVKVDPRATDVETFNQLELGDVWADANLVSVYKYLRQGVTIPDTWHQVFVQLDGELLARGLIWGSGIVQASNLEMGLESNSTCWHHKTEIV